MMGVRNLSLITLGCSGVNLPAYQQFQDFPLLGYNPEHPVLLASNSRRVYAYEAIPSSFRKADKPERSIEKGSVCHPCRSDPRRHTCLCRKRLWNTGKTGKK
jgi:hypothetical protein